jgi:TolB protein
MSRCLILIMSLLVLVLPGRVVAQGDRPTPNEDVLGELLITGDNQDMRPRLAILPSLSPDLEDVIVRGVVRRDFELTGLYRMIDDAKAPPGLYGFDDPVDVQAWTHIGADIVIKVAARKNAGKVEVLGVAYLMSSGGRPVYKKTIAVQKEEVRLTAHRVVDALLGALTGRKGGFASRLAFSAKWGRNHTVFTVDADGHNITRQTDPSQTSMSPSWGPAGYLFYVESKNYAPFKMKRLGERRALALKFDQSIYGVAFNADGTRLAVSVAQENGSAIWVGNSDGTDMKKVSKTAVAIHPVFSPSGKLAWIGGGVNHGSQRVYVEGKAVSPSGFTAASPAFCDTEDGIRLVFSVSVGGDRRDLVMSGETGGKTYRLTRNQGSNTYPACSPDGRLLAFFSTRRGKPGLYVKSLKSFAAQKISGRVGESLRWGMLPPPSAPQPTAAEVTEQ